MTPPDRDPEPTPRRTRLVDAALLAGGVALLLLGAVLLVTGGRALGAC